jgi:hypothetical protein
MEWAFEECHVRRHGRVSNAMQPQNSLESIASCSSSSPPDRDRDRLVAGEAKHEHKRDLHPLDPTVRSTKCESELKTNVQSVFMMP